MKAALLVLAVPLILTVAVVADSAQVPTKSAAVTTVPSMQTDKTTGMEFILVKGGCYQMGDTVGDGEKDEKPAHEVCVKDFYLGKYEVTQGQWQTVMGDNPSAFKECGPDCPVEFVSWDMVKEFIDKLNSMGKNTYRLPTEAEWEYAARSGGKAEKWAGTGNEAALEEYAWFGKNSESMTHKVGQKKPNGLGLYDMTGNVREWCQDWYDENYYGKKVPKDDPVGGEDVDGRRVLRGGDWERVAKNIRNSTRNGNMADLQTSLYGFRLLLPVK
jgi:formylglycine-generating enzyme required for sulfatase activity